MKYGYLDPQKKIKVSKICLGTMTWGYQNTEAEAFEQLDYAYSQGINFVDTAEIYAIPPSKETYGKTETFIGNWFAKNKNIRNQIVLASKMAGPGPVHIRDGIGLNSKDLTLAVDGSLKRLQTDYIDLYQLHWPQRKVNYFDAYNYNPTFYSAETTEKEIDQIGEILNALAQEIEKGKIRYVGLSNETSWGVMQFKNASRLNPKLPTIVSIQNAYSLVSRLFDTNLAEVCMKEQVGLLAYSPLAGGLLSGKYRNNQKPEGARFSTWGNQRMGRYKSPLVLEAAEKYAAIAEANQMTPSQLALAFINQQAHTTSNIIGATTMEQLKENIDSIHFNLDDQLLKEINDVFLQYGNPAP